MSKNRCRPQIQIRPTLPSAARRLGWALGQLSDRQPQLCHRGSTSDGSTDESGNGGRAGHAHPLHTMARTRARIGSGRHDPRERGVLALVGGSEHHSLYANSRQYPPKEQPVLRSRALHLSTRKQQLSLSCGGTGQLCRPECSQPRCLGGFFFTTRGAIPFYFVFSMGVTSSAQS
jgi:hypothetical protein